MEAEYLKCSTQRDKWTAKQDYFRNKQYKMICFLKKEEDQTDSVISSISQCSGTGPLYHGYNMLCFLILFVRLQTRKRAVIFKLWILKHLMLAIEMTNERNVSAAVWNHRMSLADIHKTLQPQVCSVLVHLLDSITVKLICHQSTNQVHRRSLENVFPLSAPHKRKSSTNRRKVSVKQTASAVSLNKHWLLFILETFLILINNIHS